MDRFLVSSNIPARVFPKPHKLKDEKFRQKYMDAFEEEAIKQVDLNIHKYNDFYRMVDGELTYVELKDYAPSLEFAQDILDSEEVDIPSHIYHYDIIGRIINAFVGKLADLEDKFFATDTGEIAENEFLMELKKLLDKGLDNIVQQAMQYGMFKNGINPETDMKFESEEEAAEFQAKMQQIQQEFVPPSAIDGLKKRFKTAGVTWAEATLERDGERMNLREKYQELFKHFLLTGNNMSYNDFTGGKIVKHVIDSRKMFTSGDIGKKYIKDFEYAGWLDYVTPSQVIERFGDRLSPKEIEILLGGKDGRFNNQDYHSETAPQSIENVAKGLFFKREIHPYAGYRSAEYAKHIEDMSGVPMSYRRFINEDGSYEDRDAFMPRGTDYGTYSRNVSIFSGDYSGIPENVCQITNVFFRGYEYEGYLYMLDEDGIPQMEVVTKDISPEFIKENNIKQIYDESIVQAGEKQHINTIVWQYRPYIYQGVKISSSRLKKPLYPIFEKLEYQVTDDSDWDVVLPLTGIVTKEGIAKKIDPFQKGYNVALNQLRQLIEKELGMFFSIDMESLPTHIRESEDVEEVMMRLRNMAKSIGLMATTSNRDNPQAGDHRNLFGVHNLSHSGEMSMRMELASFYENKAYQAVGLFMQQEMSATKYTTAQGVKLSNESMSNQIAHIFETFNGFIKDDKIQHLNNAQFLQFLGYDNTMFYNKSNASIEFIRVTNEMNIPWRKLGLTVTEDSRNRRAFEELRQYLMSQNTLGGDLLSISKTILSNNVTEIIQASIEERERQAEIAEQTHQNEMQRIERENELAVEREQAVWEREELSKQRDRESREYQKYIGAIGAAADNNATPESIDEIHKTYSSTQRDNELQFKRENAEANRKVKSEEIDHKQKMREKEIEQEERRLELREKKMESDERIAAMNKN